MKRFLFTFSLLLLFGSSIAQYDPSFYREVVIQNDFGIAISDYTALIVFDTQSEVAGGDMQNNGDDIRFVKYSNGCPATYYDYWIEKDMNTTNTYIWVRLPLLLSGTADTLRMYYGDPNANAVSDFNATFPNAIINPGTITLSGVQDVGWLELSGNDTIYVQKDSRLDMFAGRVSIEGSAAIEASGRGYGNNVQTNTDGLGPGGGIISTDNNAGASGATFGGNGGTGGYDTGDSPNIAPSTYGNPNTAGVMLGSAGGNTDDSYGGNGGGAVIIYGHEMYIDNDINANGADGETASNVAQGAGGGSGGGITLFGNDIEIGIDGDLRAEGGNGTDGNPTNGDGGGGGGGGRIKVFYGANFVDNSTTGGILFDGGLGGAGGGTAPEDGAQGTYTNTQQTQNTPLVGAKTPAAWTGVNTEVDRYGAQLTAQESNGNYQWYDCNTQQSIAGATSQSFTPNNNGSYQVEITNSAGCTAFSACYGVNNVSTEDVEQGTVSIFPNPTDGNISIQTQAWSNSYHLQIFNATGQLVEERPAVNQSQLQIELPQAAGLYLIRLKSEDGRELNRKIIKR